MVRIWPFFIRITWVYFLVSPAWFWFLSFALIAMNPTGWILILLGLIFIINWFRFKIKQWSISSDDFCNRMHFLTNGNNDKRRKNAEEWRHWWTPLWSLFYKSLKNHLGFTAEVINKDLWLNKTPTALSAVGKFLKTICVSRQRWSYCYNAMQSLDF